MAKSTQSVFKDRKSQQQTLSIRVSESVRGFLERARKQFSDRSGESVSISDVAKLLLEGAIESRLDDRLETADLLANPTAALLGVRRKWADNQQLTRAEYIVLAQYVQSGCDALATDPELPSRESFARLIEALLAVRSLRLGSAPELDHYYLGNLTGWTQQSEEVLKGGPQAAEIVPSVVRRTVDGLRNSPGFARPPFAGRNLYVAVRDEPLESVDSLNRVLMPYLPCLYNLAARGHWLVEHCPLRETRRNWPTLESRPPHVPDIKVQDIRLSISLGDDGELHMLLNFKTRRVLYALGPYPHIREFKSMLDTLAPGKTWNGHYFFGKAEGPEEATADPFFFREHAKGVLVAFTEEEWSALRQVFEQVMKLAELKPALSELALAYGEV